jgi:hypothetical protein
MTEINEINENSEINEIGETSCRLIFEKNHIKSNQIIKKIKDQQFKEILNGIGHIRNSCIIIEFKFFKYFSMPSTHDLITSHMDQITNEIVSKYNNFNVHLNLQSFSIADADKHSTYIRSIASFFANKYPDKLNKCYIYNASFFFETILKIINTFIDKDTLKKIVLIK